MSATHGPLISTWFNPLFLFIAMELNIAAFRSSLPPETFCLAQTPTRGCVLPMICVVGVAYGSLSLDVTRSSRSLRFSLHVLLVIDVLLGRDLFRSFRGIVSTGLLGSDGLWSGFEGEK